jgi:subtilisin family serine protease
VLDPDGDPQTDDAPQVVNASWSSERLDCAAEFAPDLEALRAAGILPVFAGGTQAPLSPANLPGAFAVGALDGPATLLSDSPIGPSPCAPAAAVFPQLVAPGADIVTTDSYGAFATAAGTSLAAAHVSGVLALALSVRPGLTAADQADLLLSTAVDLGQPGPDNAFGFGRVDAGRAVAQARLASLGPGVWLALGLGLGVGGWLVYLRRRER